MTNVIVVRWSEIMEVKILRTCDIDSIHLRGINVMTKVTFYETLYTHCLWMGGRVEVKKVHIN